MATLRKNIAGQVLLRFESMLPERVDMRLAVRGAGENFPLNPLGLQDGWLQIANDLYRLERIAVRARADLELVFLDAASRVVQVEPLLFDASFFAGLMEYGRDPVFAPFAVEAYAKPAELALFTHARDEQLFLSVFLDYYHKVLPWRDIYIIDHGSQRCVSEQVAGLGCQVVRIPCGEVDHVNIKRYCEHFQRFLLTQYRWVIHVDCDELLVHSQGPQAIRAALAQRDADCVIKPAQAYHLVQHPDLEPELDPRRPVTAQRKYLTSAAGYDKPAIAAVPTSWMPGFHATLDEHQVREVPELALIHLAQVSVGERLARNRRWHAYPSSSSDRAYVDHRRRFLTEEEVAADLRTMIHAGSVPLPDWLLGQF